MLTTSHHDKVIKYIVKNKVPEIILLHKDEKSVHLKHYILNSEYISG